MSKPTQAQEAAALALELQRWQRKVEGDGMRTEREVQFHNRIANETILANLPLILAGLTLVAAQPQETT